MTSLTISPNTPDTLTLQITDTNTLQLNSTPIVVVSGDSGGVAWGDITGTLSDQADLQDAFNLKLDAADYNDRFLGLFATYFDLVAAHPTASAGDYAQVDFGIGTDVIIYAWDVSDEQWSAVGSSAIANTDALPEGSSNLYFTSQRVRDTSLTGLSTATATPITATDSVLSGAGKLQAQISGLGNGYDFLFARGRANLNRLLFNDLNPAQIIHNGFLTVPAEYNVIGGACLFNFDLYTATTGGQSGTFRIFVNEVNLINSASSTLGVSSADGLALSCELTFLRSSASFCVLVLRINGANVAKQRINNPNIPAAGNPINFSVRFLTTASQTTSLEYIESMVTMGYGNKP